MGAYLDNAATSWPKPETVYQAVECFVRQVLRLARRDDPQEILHFVKEVIAKKVEAALRMRCG